MTENQEKVLKKYERQILTAHKAKYYVGLAPDDIRKVYEVYNELFPHQRETYTTCNACVLKVLDKLYPKLEEINQPKTEEEVTVVEEPKKPVQKKGKGKKNEKTDQEG